MFKQLLSLKNSWGPIQNKSNITLSQFYYTHMYNDHKQSIFSFVCVALMWKLMKPL